MDRCSNCGAPLEGGTCAYCGTAVQTGSPSSSPNNTYQSQTVVKGNYQASVNYAQGRQSPKNKTAVLILAIVLGIYGVHYFYAGKIGMGLLYFFTVGLFGIGWIVDIIRIATGNFTDSNGLPIR